MLPNLGQVSENQRQFSNRLLCSRRSFVRDNRNGLLNTGELWSVTSGRMEKLSLSLKRMGRRPALPVSHADWCEPWPRRARPGPLHEMPGRARLIDDLILKSWVKSDSEFRFRLCHIWFQNLRHATQMLSASVSFSVKRE